MESIKTEVKFVIHKWEARDIGQISNFKNYKYVVFS
jgi:hypothetical protein